jgi:CheY-like chemotaxis protein
MLVVLVVDDEAYSRYATVRALQAAGFDVRECSNGLEGLRAAREQPDVIILDIRLPDTDGFEVCRLLKSDPATRAIPVILKTAYVEAAGGDRARNVGADDLVVDSGDVAPVRSAVERVLRR